MLFTPEICVKQQKKTQTTHEMLKKKNHFTCVVCSTRVSREMNVVKFQIDHDDDDDDEEKLENIKRFMESGSSQNKT